MKLVVLSAGMTGRTCELKVERTTIGRSDDNTFPIADPSVSSHHCEVLLRGQDVIVRDLNSTNGTYIDGVETKEGALKPAQILRLGQIQMRLETAAPVTSGKKQFDRTAVIPGGVQRSEFDQPNRQPGFDTKAAGFSKRGDEVNRIFIVIGIVFGVVIGALLLYLFTTIRK